MKRLGVLAAACGAFATTAALGTQGAGAQTAVTTNIVYASHDTPNAAQAKLACDAPTNTTNCHIFVMNTDGAGRAVTNGGANDLDPAFSPDGKRIAFARAVGGPSGQYDIYVMDANGANVSRLTTEPRDDRYPAWSPDGTKIAFRGYSAAPGTRIFTMNPDGTGQGAIAGTEGGDQPTWSPDGTRVAYTGTYAGPPDPVTGVAPTYDDIFVQNVNGTGTPNNVTNDQPMSDRYPSWNPAPGSNQILFRRVEATGRELYRVDASNEAVGNFTVAQTNSIGRAASWAPDGKSAAFVSYVDPEHDQEIWLGNVNVFNNTITGARQLTNNALTDDEPKLASVPVASSPVPVATGQGGGTVSGGGTGITVGGGTPGAGGRSALSLTLVVPRQSLRRHKTLLAFARCNRRCAVNVTGFTKMKVRGKTRTLRLFRAKRTINGNVRARLRLRIPTRTLRTVRSALRRHKRVKFSISATARTTAGEFTPAAVRKLTLRR
jgi:WD40 repeat protein